MLWYIFDFCSILPNFTPGEIETPNVVPTDRPYGSLIAFGSTRLNIYNEEASANIKNQFSLRTSFHLGILGLPVGEAVQKGIHGSPIFPDRADPEGWDNQISDGFEPTILYRMEARKPLALIQMNPDERPEDTWFQLNGFADIMAGWYVSSSIGVNMRLGIMNKPYWAMNGGYIGTIGAQDPSSDETRKFSIFLFSNIRGRYMWYNALLQGQFRRSVHTFNEDQISRYIREFDFGLGISYQNCNLIWTAFRMRTAEFKTDLSRNHYWGSILLTINHSQGHTYRERFIGAGRIDAGRALDIASSRIGIL